MEKDQEMESSKIDYSDETSPQYHDYLLAVKKEDPLVSCVGD